MKKSCFGLIILFCFSPLIKSQSIKTESPNLANQNESITQSREWAGQYKVGNSFSKSSLVLADLDTAKLLSDQPLKSPMGAVLRSAVLPGWGQIYNEKYLKGLFIFSVNGAFAYEIYHNHKEWNDTGNKKFQNKRNLYTWYFGISYFLTLIDAFVDAYLFGFDEAVELALPFQEQSPGLALADPFGLMGAKQDFVGVKISIELKPGTFR